MSSYNDIAFLDKFYRSMHFKGFKFITDERKCELDEIVLKWYSFFRDKNENTYSFMCRVARWLLVSDEPFGLKSDDEILYFYINIIDPELLFLECYESANTRKDFVRYCLINFNTFDSRIVIIEKYFNKRFKKYGPNDLWTLERIKKEY